MQTTEREYLENHKAKRRIEYFRVLSALIGDLPVYPAKRMAAKICRSLFGVNFQLSQGDQEYN